MGSTGMRVGQVSNAPYTDLAVLMGPYARWTEDDYEDLVHQVPEVFLGYRVLLTTVDLAPQHLRGRRLHKAVISDAATLTGRFTNAMGALLPALVPTEGTPRYEYWYIHRAGGTRMLSRREFN
jgi:hypothetical protein